MCFCEHWPEWGTTGCSVLWQGDSGSKTGPLLLAMPPGHSTSTHCSSSSSVCWLTGRPMGAWDWLASPQASGTKSIRDTPKNKRQKFTLCSPENTHCTIQQSLGIEIHRKREEKTTCGNGFPPYPLIDPPYLRPLHMNHTCSCINFHTCLSSTNWIMCPLCMSFCRRRTHRVENKVLCGCSMWD